MLCLAPPVMWFAHLSALYGLASFGEAAGLDSVWFDVIAWLATGVACIAVAVMWHQSQRTDMRHDGPAEGANTVARVLAVLSLVGILFQGLVLAIVEP